MPSLPLFPPEPQAVQTPPGKGKSKAAKARKKRKAAAEAAPNTPAAVVNLPKSDSRPTQQELPVAAGVTARVSELKTSSFFSSDMLSTCPSLSIYQNVAPPPLSPALPPRAAAPSPVNDVDDGFIVVTHSKRPKNQWNHTQEEEKEATELQYWWNGGVRPPDETWDWEHGTELRTHKVETWLEALQQLTLDPPETPVIEHIVEPKQTVVPKRVLRQVAGHAVSKPKPQVRWGK
ncbi:hypothetical protein D9619_013392 [Psilocybe cf. subviscida]|uniref:Uncharacterized protein n=1 Tax=Psilocybe cf. subviscida TaxID=2480587 RepID=A0A8H5BS81_9AGAR|nr:hypothetical protein D9619_013392 [Psilocybe cf. subviscida]